MKYVRTNDGIFEIKIDEDSKKRGISNYFYFRRKDYDCKLYLKKSDLKNYKQADTIEELCDEFVDIYKNEKPETTLLSDIIYFEMYKHHIIYGAIWTDKGLIYVAKMNDKGELELL